MFKMKSVTTAIVGIGLASVVFPTYAFSLFGALAGSSDNDQGPRTRQQQYTYSNDYDDNGIPYYYKNRGQAKKSNYRKTYASSGYSYRRVSGNGGFPETRAATGKRVFIYNPNTLVWAAYDKDGTLVKVGPGSSGRSYCPDIGRGCKTPSGTYHVYSKAGADYRSKIFPVGRGGAPMPYAMFFRGGYAVHGSYDVPNYNASHGCIRVHPEDAQWLNTSFLNNGSTVIVYPY